MYLGNEENGSDYGRIHVIRKRVGAGCEAGVLAAGESLILDFGQNIVGRPRLRVKARRGAVIRGYFAEMLNDSGLALRGNDGPEGSLYIKTTARPSPGWSMSPPGTGRVLCSASHFYGFRYLD